MTEEVSEWGAGAGAGVGYRCSGMKHNVVLRSSVREVLQDGC